MATPTGQADRGRSGGGGARRRAARRGRSAAGAHVPVLVRRVLRHLRPRAGEVVADCTLGYGGHAVELLERIGPDGRLIGLDVDGAQLQRARRRLAEMQAPAVVRRRNFAELAAVMESEGLDGFNIIFADLGVSSMQVDEPSRGISYRSDGPLDMRMDDRLAKTGADVLAALSRDELSAALRDLSDEPDHERIAEWIVNQRRAGPIERVDQLVRLVLNAKGIVPRRDRRPRWDEYGPQHPAARTFQALRILVNDELGNLERLLAAAPSCLRPGGRVGIISFHSGEDRLVKQAFREGLRSGVYSAVAAKPVTPGPREIRTNPRSASAKFRWAKR